MMNKQTVKILYYRWAGRFLFWRIKTRCEECDLTYTLLTRLMADAFRGKPVELCTMPWLNNWWRVLPRGGWHAPIITVNGRVFSQGIVPDAHRLIRAVADELDDQELRRRAEDFAPKKTPLTATPRQGETTLYFSPACPHCRQVQAYLDANHVEYRILDVTQSAAAREQVQTLTGRMTIPIVVKDDNVVAGFDCERLRGLLGIDANMERAAAPSAGVDGTAPGAQNAIPTPRPEADELKRATEAAKSVLRGNCTDGRTRASRHLYPHQWNWDAGFIARGYQHFDPKQAYREIRLLFQGQWSDGFLPHIIFNENYLNHFPSPEYWQAERSGRVPDGVHTSGISQPPVHAGMLVRAPELDPDAERATRFLREMYPKLRKLHDYFFTERDPHNEGLVYLVHPWESGIDNAPIWDEPLSAITATSDWARQMQARYDELAKQGDRPSRPYIEKYSYLVESLFERKYNWDRIAAEHPFRIQDVLFNSVLCRAERDLGTIAEIIGADPSPHRERAKTLADAINRKLWDEERGLYFSYDLCNQTHIRRDTVFSYLPLYAGACEAEDGKTLVDNLRAHCFCLADRDCVGIPVYDMCQIDFEGEFYWRGPVWYNICWYMVHGLRQYGEDELAQWLTDSLLRLVADHGFHEYYEPQTGKGLGADDFSWTAALFLDLASGGPAS